MSKTDSSGGYNNLSPAAEQARNAALAVRFELLCRAAEIAAGIDWEAGPGAVVLARKPGIPTLTGSPIMELRIPVRMLYESTIAVDSAHVEGKPVFLHAGFALDQAGRILQFTNGGGEYRTSEGRTIEIVSCEPLGPDPAADQLVLSAGEVQLAQPFASYEAYAAAGVDFQLQTELDGLVAQSS